MSMHGVYIDVDEYILHIMPHTNAYNGAHTHGEKNRGREGTTAPPGAKEEMQPAAIARARKSAAVHVCAYVGQEVWMCRSRDPLRP